VQAKVGSLVVRLTRGGEGQAFANVALGSRSESATL
jgi:hypothetical protein